MNTATMPNLGLAPETEQRASDVLRAMGLTVFDAFRLVLMRIAADGRFPFDVAAPEAVSGGENREQETARERAQRALAALRSQAALNGTADMPLDEINEEIRAARAQANWAEFLKGEPVDADFLSERPELFDFERADKLFEGWDG